MKKVSPVCWVIFLLAVIFGLATFIVPRASDWNGENQGDNFLKQVFGEGRKLFANESFVMADVYYHSGYYPSIFDKQEQEHDVAQPAHGKHKEAEAETTTDFFGNPPDWLARFELQFVPNAHTHLDSGGATGHQKSRSVEEILPWLKLAADLNPKMIETYTVGAYWLQTTLHKPQAAREFLLDGLKHNPGNSELQFDLGRVYYEGFHDANRARNVWQAALRNWETQSSDAKTNPAVQLVYEEITMNLAHLEEGENHWPEAIKYLEMVKAVSPNPQAIEDRIAEIRRKAAGGK